MTQFLLFLAFLGLGATLRVLYFLAALLAKSTHLKAMHYIFDVIWCAIAFISFAAMVFLLHDGKFEGYMLLGICAGLGIASVIFSVFKKENRKRK